MNEQTNETAPAPRVVPKWHIHRRMYDWVLHWAQTPYALPALIVLSFMESSFFPIPPDVLLIALVLGRPASWLRYAAWCTAASVVGGVAGYGIGVFAWETVGRWIVENVAHMKLVMVDGRADIAMPGYMIKAMGDSLGGEYLFQVYDKWNAWIVYIFGLTPLPYKLVTITAGVARVDLTVFILTSIAGRATRFFAVAWILKKWGPAAKDFIDRYFNLLSLVFVVLLVGAFVLLAVLM